jgi:uroporphyrinogen decarboxylase
MMNVPNPILNSEFLTLTRNLDVEAFWEENELCFEFTTAKPRCALIFAPDDHWLFEFLQAPAALPAALPAASPAASLSTLRYYQDKEERDRLHREANRWLMEYVGKVFFDEDTWQTSPKRIENLFGSEFAYREGSTPWLMAVPDDPDEFACRLDQVERIDLTSWALPDAFRAEWEQRKAAGKPLPRLGTGSRGPATIMTSVLPFDKIFYWFFDHPALMERFRDLLAEKMVELNTILRQFSGNTEPGWWITDDNSALFNVRLYKTYCYPVLERVLEAMAPGDAPRYQHSDSAMGHLIDLQYELGIRSVNYGPTVDAGLIRSKMPEAMIHGQLPPFTLRNGTPDEIRQRVREDFRKAGSSGGLTVATAGSLAAGTGLGRMRWLMQVVQEECRYGSHP